MTDAPFRIDPFGCGDTNTWSRPWNRLPAPLPAPFNIDLGAGLLFEPLDRGVGELTLLFGEAIDPDGKASWSSAPPQRAFSVFRQTSGRGWFSQEL